MNSQFKCTRMWEIAFTSLKKSVGEKPPDPLAKCVSPTLKMLLTPMLTTVVFICHHLVLQQHENGVEVKQTHACANTLRA